MRAPAVPDPTPIDRFWFISYSRAQFYATELLAHRLDAHNITTWLDIQQLQVGRDWAQAILDAIAACEGFVLMVSHEALASDSVQAEWRAALQHHKPIIFVLLDSTPLPPELADYDRVIGRLDTQHRFDTTDQRIAQIIHQREPMLDRIPTPADPNADVWRYAGPHVKWAIGALQWTLGLNFISVIITTVGVAWRDNSLVAGLSLGSAVLVILAPIVWFLNREYRRIKRRHFLRYRIATTATLQLVISSANYAMITWGLGYVYALGAVLIGVSVLAAAYAIVAVEYTADWLRFAPTGHAPNRLRRRLCAISAHDLPADLSVSSPSTFFVAAAPQDRKLAGLIGHVLSKTGHLPSPLPTAEYVFLVITNFTTDEAVQRVAADCTGRLMPLLCVSRDVSEVLPPDYRTFHVYDFRNQSRRTLRALALVLGQTVRPSVNAELLIVPSFKLPKYPSMLQSHISLTNLVAGTTVLNAFLALFGLPFIDDYSISDSTPLVELGILAVFATTALFGLRQLKQRAIHFWPYVPFVLLTGLLLFIALSDLIYLFLIILDQTHSMGLCLPLLVGAGLPFAAILRHIWLWTPA